jgi:hypothetical protein
MTSPCFITPTVVVLVEKEGVTKPDVPNDCDWYVWRGNGKGYGVPRRIKHRRTTATTTTTMMMMMIMCHELLRKSMMRHHVCCAVCMEMMKSIFIIVQ